MGRLRLGGRLQRGLGGGQGAGGGKGVGRRRGAAQQHPQAGGCRLRRRPCVVAALQRQQDAAAAQRRQRLLQGGRAVRTSMKAIITQRHRHEVLEATELGPAHHKQRVLQDAGHHPATPACPLALHRAILCGRLTYGGTHVVL